MCTLPGTGLEELGSLADETVRHPTRVSGRAYMTITTTLPVEQVGATLIIRPSHNLSELAFEQIEVDADHALKLLDEAHATNVVIDFESTDYFGSTALSFFIKLWKHVREANGRMAFCNLSEHECEILAVAKLDATWAICDTLDAALKSVSRQSVIRAN